MKIGIDLGTSYSSVAAEIDGKIEMIKVSTGASAFGDSFSMPTAVYIDNGKALLGQAALNRRKISPACFRSEFKREFGTATPYIISGEEYLPEQLYTEIFLYFKEQAIKQMGEKIEKVFLTHPANYGNNKKRLLEKAANNAGFFDIVLVDEPTAAAAGYSRKNKIVEGDILLVYDLGGGTFDTAIIKKTKDGYLHLTEPLGISQCGGVDFDRVIFDDIINKINQSGNYDVEQMLQEKRFTAALSEVCVQIKHQLSLADNHIEAIAVGAFDYFEYTITRQEFEDMIRPLITNTCEKVKDILKNSGLSESDIDKVLLVGGSTRIPLVGKMVSDTLKKDICFDADPELAVCQGALSLGGNKKTENSKDGEKIGDKNNIVVDEKSMEKKNIAGDEKTGIEVPRPADVDRNVNEYQKFLEAFKRDAENNKLLLGPGKEEGLKNNWKRVDLKDAGIGAEEGRKNEQEIKSQEEVIKSDITKGEDKKEEQGNNKAGNNVAVQMTENDEYMLKLMSRVLFGYYALDGEWIYYTNEEDKLKLYKIKIDGTQKTKLTDLKAKPPIKIRDGWVYYQVNIGDESRKYKLYKIKTDGVQEARISDRFIYCSGYNPNFEVRDEWIYFVDEDQTLMKMRTDGSCISSMTIDKGINKLIMDMDWIYYWNYDNLYKVSLNGENRTLLCGCSEIIDHVSICNGWAVYNSFQSKKRLFTEVWTHKLWRVREDGTGNCMLANEFIVNEMNSIDGLIYYISRKDKEIYSMKNDMTNVRHITKDMLKKRIQEGNI